MLPNDTRGVAAVIFRSAAGSICSSGVPLLDLHIGYGHHLPDLSREWRDHLRLHLHGFEHGQAVAGGNHVARLYGDGDDHRRRGRAYHAAVIAIDAMGNAVRPRSGSSGPAPRKRRGSAARKR